MVHSSEISCLNHSFPETIVINRRWIFQNWKAFMFLRGQYTKTSLTFLTAIMVLEILNNVGKHFLQKIPVKSSFCRDNCGQYIVQKWRRFMFLRGKYTKTSLTFLTAIMFLEILNNVGKHFWQKILVNSSLCREDGGKYKIHHTKLKERFFPKRPIYKNLSHVFHNHFRMRDTCTYLQAIFQTL